MRDWYDLEQTTRPVQDTTHEPITWVRILENWIPITLDLHQYYGVDTESGVLEQRTWWWLEDRILDLIDRPSRLREALGIPASATRA